MTEDNYGTEGPPSPFEEPITPEPIVNVNITPNFYQDNMITRLDQLISVLGSIDDHLGKLVQAIGTIGDKMGRR